MRRLLQKLYGDPPSRFATIVGPQLTAVPVQGGNSERPSPLPLRLLFRKTDVVGLKRM